MDNDHPGVLADITRVLAQKQLSILTVVVDRQSDQTVVELQIETKEAQLVKDILSDAGFTVISAVVTNP